MHHSHSTLFQDNPSEKDINQGTLVVFNLDPSVSNDDLRQIFGAYGEVKEIRETPHKRHHKFIEFYDVRAAEAALRALNRSDIAGKRIKLEPSRPGGARRKVIFESKASPTLSSLLSPSQLPGAACYYILMTSSSWPQFGSPGDHNPLHAFSKSPGQGSLSPIGSNNLTGLASILPHHVSSSPKIAPIGKDTGRVNHVNQIFPNTGSTQGAAYPHSRSLEQKFSTSPGPLSSFGESNLNSSGIGTLSGPQFLWGSPGPYPERANSSAWQTPSVGYPFASSGQGQGFPYANQQALDRDLAGLLKPIITLRPPRVVFDDATVKRTSHSSERTKFEIEEIGDEASQMNPEGIQESLTDEDWTGPLERLFAEEGSKEKLTLEPQAVVFDVEAVKMTSNSSEQTKFEIEEIGNEASQTRQPEGIQDNKLSVLPENPRCPELSALFIQRNYKLRTIPPSFFDHMPALQILNLSRTGIKSLPDSVISLVSLKRLFLNDCHRFMMLSPNIGELKQLEVLDLDKTQIMDLPKEIKKLTNLTCLEVSFCGTYVQSNVVVIPCGVISALSQLEELNIDVDPDDERWDACVEAIVNEVCTLKRLETLKFYFPRLELLRKIQMNIPSLFNFRFIVGRHVKRLMSRVPPDVEIELERWERCLKYINGVGVPREIQKVLQHATAFFLDRHASIKKISDFGNRNMEDLKCLVIGEFYGAFGRGQYRGIHYCLLKSLTLVTCPQLTTIFTQGLLANLCNLEELKVEDCPSINNLVSFEISAEHKASDFLPNLKKISLHYMPGLVSISGGLHIAPKLEWLSFYNCPNLKNPLIDEVSTQDLKKIKGERSWWEALEWSNGCPDYLDEIFVQIDILDC
uniref:RRM domain-containing protein n=1 Tax=Fagus sylvatica TaxID=28930 RepID=A0A2N9FGH1_FAGSY